MKRNVILKQTFGLARTDDVMRQRRRAVLVEAGIEHEELARILSIGRDRPLSRSAITNLLAGHYSSEGFSLERRLIEEVQKRLRQMGQIGRANQITMDYLGWPSLEPV